MFSCFRIFTHFLAVKLLWRDVKTGELNLLFAAVTVAVMSVTAITLFTERLQKSLVSESQTFLAAQLVLQSPVVVNSQWLNNEYAKKIQQAQTVQFSSMVFAEAKIREGTEGAREEKIGEEMFLASVKAVSEAYPLLGQLEISKHAFGEGVKVQGRPKPGEAWLDSRLLNLLNIGVGDKVWVGDASFEVTQILAREPDGGSSYGSLGPRILISLNDLPKTHIVQEGSRVQYRYLFSGENSAIESYKNWLQEQVEPRHKLLTLADSQPGLAQSLKRAESFLLLASCLAIVLAAIAVAMAARRYSLRHFDTIALLKVLGAPKNTLKQNILLPLIALTVGGTLLGALLGSVMQYAFLSVMTEWLPAVLPAATWRPYALGAGTALVCVMGFALPLLWHLLGVPPLRVLRRDLGDSLGAQWRFYFSGGVAIFSLMWFFSQNLPIALSVFIGTVLVGVLSALCAFFLLNSLGYVGERAGGIWRLALARLQRNGMHSVLQLVIFSLIFMLLLVSILMRSSLVKEWQQQLPEGTPNQFLINVAPYQVEQIKKILLAEKIEVSDFYPMVRGRLTAIKGKQVTQQDIEQHESLSRELNLTWAQDLPEDNRIASGQWWEEYDVFTPRISGPKISVPKVSIEEALAKELKLTVGDFVTFNFGEKSLTVKISSVRTLSWDRMRPNFYFIFEPGVLDKFPATYITSFYLPVEQKWFLNHLLKTFPTVSLFSVDEIIRRIQAMVKQVSGAIEWVLLLVLLAGVLVFIATIQASMDTRLQETAVLRSLGASRRLILGSLALEFVVLGSVAGLMAALGSALIVAGLQVYIFQTEWVFYVWPWLAGPVFGVWVLSVTGLLACGKVVRMPPWLLLRELNA